MTFCSWPFFGGVSISVFWCPEIVQHNIAQCKLQGGTVQKKLNVIGNVIVAWTVCMEAWKGVQLADGTYHWKWLIIPWQRPWDSRCWIETAASNSGNTIVVQQKRALINMMSDLNRQMTRMKENEDWKSNKRTDPDGSKSIWTCNPKIQRLTKVTVRTTNKQLWSKTW